MGISSVTKQQRKWNEQNQKNAYTFKLWENILSTKVQETLLAHIQVRKANTRIKEQASTLEVLSADLGGCVSFTGLPKAVFNTVKI